MAETIIASVPAKTEHVNAATSSSARRRRAARF
jgi:hypothetical protein